MKWQFLATTALTCALAGWSSVSPPLAKAQTSAVVFQEDFSQGFEKWDILRNSGQYWSLKDGQAEAYLPWGSTLAEMVPKDAYWDSAWHDIEYELDYTPLEGVDKNISFSFENLLNWYEIHFTEHWYNLVRLDDGRVRFEVNNPYTMTNGQTYRLLIRFQQGRIQIYINGQQIANELDWTFNNNYGKIGIKAGTGAVAPTRVRYDNIVVRTLNATPPPPAPSPGISLNVPLLKQTDAAWANQEYDTATSWSDKPTIQRWGCAMTSVAMVMRFHGLTTMPDGQPVNPATVNAWLKSQADGYLNGGSVNWQAATRLTRLISEKFGTVKLEYARREGASLDTAKAEIAARKPVVLQIDGHFLVGDGVTADQSDLLIKDPAYTHSKFGQHHKPLLSTRLFQPSHTDLSYLLLTHQPGIKVKLKDDQGQDIAGVETFTDHLSDQVDGSGERNPAVVQHQLAKPANGTYLVEVSRAELGATELSKYTLDIYAYDTAANPTLLHWSGWVSQRPQYFRLTYRRDGSSQLTPLVSWAEFRQDLRWLSQAGLIKHSSLYAQLDKLASNGEVATATWKSRLWLQVVEQMVKVSGTKITDQARAYLLQRIEQLQTILEPA